MKLMLCIAPITVLIAACAVTEPTHVDPTAQIMFIKLYGREAVSLCSGKTQALAGKPILKNADHVYLEVKPRITSVSFWHGARGTFGERTPGNATVLGCAVMNGPPMKVIFLGEPLKTPILSNSNYSNLGSAKGATEVLFKRDDDALEYCCFQEFSIKNFPNVRFRGWVN